jgi:glyoxylase-like metal-dependent hydrolase (beta-lactamase superfamily II)
MTMPASKNVVFVPEMSANSRIRVFRRTFNPVGEFEGMEVDAYIVFTDAYMVVFDTMLCPEDVSIMMHMVQDEVGKRTILVVNSHADWDHAWGNAYFRGEHTAPIIAHEYGRIRLLSDEARTELTDYQQRYPIFRNVELVPPTITFNQHLTLYDGQMSIEIFPAQGHHRDHIAAWLPELRLLLAFDAVENPLPCIENAEAVPSMFATLEHFIALQPERVLCSHGKTISPALVQKNLAYLREVEHRSRQLLLAHHPAPQELEHASTLIAYPLEEVIADATGRVDRTFYGWAHDANVRYILEWLMSNF